MSAKHNVWTLRFSDTLCIRVVYTISGEFDINAIITYNMLKQRKLIDFY